MCFERVGLADTHRTEGHSSKSVQAPPRRNNNSSLETENECVPAQVALFQTSRVPLASNVCVNSGDP